MPQRGYGLQPRVAASATLGKERDLVFNRNAVASGLYFSLRKRRNRVAVEVSFSDLFPEWPKRQHWAGGRCPVWASLRTHRSRKGRIPTLKTKPFCC